MSDGDEPPRKKIYGYFVGNIDQTAIQRLSNTIAVTTQQGFHEIHILFQTNGGTVSDGVCLYNIFNEAPLEVHLYNCGSVASIGVIAYLGAAHRYTTKNATFMIHKTTFSPVAATVDRLQSLANAAAIDDERVQEIFHREITLPQEKWDMHKVSDLWLSAEDAVKARIADGIREFSPTFGEQIFYFGV